MTKEMNEWYLSTPWGKLAMVSWGKVTNSPILLVHGYMDTAATFINLIDQLPDDYYYVGFDMPGHGKSEPFPSGPLISQLHIVEVIRRVILHLKWKSFTYIAHSMGCVIGMFYNHLYPGKITKFVHIDPGPPISMFYYVHHQPKFWFQYMYKDYYDHYERYNSERSRLYTTDEAINLVARNRELSEEQAETVLSRALIPKGNDKFKLSWEPRVKKIATIPVSEETLYTVMTKYQVPTLVVEVSNSPVAQATKEFVQNIMEKCKDILPNYFHVKVEGSHDVHITNPELIKEHLAKFLMRKFNGSWSFSKL